jgi:hypothetical protein
MTRDDAIREAIMALGRWHQLDDGDRCVCREAEQFGAQWVVVIDALAANGVSFDGYSGLDRGPLGPPVVQSIRLKGGSVAQFVPADSTNAAQTP